MKRPELFFALAAATPVIDAGCGEGSIVGQDDDDDDDDTVERQRAREIAREPEHVFAMLPARLHSAHVNSPQIANDASYGILAHGYLR